MPDKEPTSTLDRRLLYAAAGFGAVVIGVLVLKMTSGGGDDVTMGVVPRPTTTAASTSTTVALSRSTVDVAAALATPIDPFNQIVSPPAASQSAPAGQPGQVSQPTQANAVSQGTSTSTTKATTKTTTTTTAAPPSTTTTTTTTANAAMSQVSLTTVPTSMSVIIPPAAVPGVSLNICVDNGTRVCTLTPAAATSVSLLTSVTLDPAALRAPTIVMGACSNGNGVASVITSGSTGTLITGSVFATVNGSQSAFPVIVGPTAPDQTVIISACVPPGVGVAIPQSGAQSTTGVLLGMVSNSLVGLLGVLSADSGLLAART